MEETKGKGKKVDKSKEEDNVKAGFLWKMISKIGIEPVVILMNLGWTMYWVQTANLYIEKTCKVGSFFFGNGTTFSNEVCDNLFNGTFPEEQEYVQTVVANVEMVSNLIKQIPCVIFALFLGPWSDRAGRKPLILVPYLGYFLFCMAMIVNTYFFDELYVEFLWFENISALCGSYVIFLIGCYGFLADTTSAETRTIRMAVMDGCLFGMEIIGNYINGPLFKQFGYYGSFGCGAFCFVSGFFFVLFFFKEPKKQAPPSESKDAGGRSAVSLKNVANSFSVLVKKREGGMRHIVILTYACFAMGSLTHTGMDYLFFRRKFTWTDEDSLISWYNHLRSYTAIGDVIALFVILPLLVRTLQLHDMTIVIIAVLSQAVKSLIYFFAGDKSSIYYVIGFSMLHCLNTQPLRSSMTKLVGQGDVGAIFACVAAGQAISGFATPLYNKIYIATMSWNVGAVYLVASAFQALILVCAIYTLIFLKRREWKNPEPNVVTTSYSRYGRF